MIRLMFKPEDFQLPMEKQLKLRVIRDEVSECRDVEALQKNLMAVAEQLMKHQQLLDATLRQLLNAELEKMDGGAVKIVKDVNTFC